MRKFVYIIGSTDDFESLDDLIAWYHQPDYEGVFSNYSAYPVELREDTQIVGYNTLEDIATVIGLGEAVQDGWRIGGLDGIVRTLIEV